jgi:hypothetical protein
MNGHRAPPMSDSRSPGEAPGLDGAAILQRPLRVDDHAEIDNKVNRWTDVPKVDVKSRMPMLSGRAYFDSIAPINSILLGS